MENAQINQSLEEMAFFLELQGGNPFKVRAFVNASRELEAKDIISLAKSGELTKIPGVGKGIQAFIKEILETGHSSELTEVAKDFPPTITELRAIRGLGPKKIKQLFDELQIASLSEFEYACNENRLLSLKGFGEKSQKNFKEALQFVKQSRGRVLLAQVLVPAQELLHHVTALAGLERAQLVGELSRFCETVEKIEILVLGSAKEWQKKLESLAKKTQLPIDCQFYFCEDKKNWDPELARLIGSTEFLVNLAKADFKHLPAPEMRESWARPKDFDRKLVEAKDIKGVFHIHTDASDGINTLEQMVKAAEDLGYEYIGISDHSQSAVYAHGLGDDRILEQRHAIDTLQDKCKIKIFHGIEADIHSDGSLDYPEKILRQFDFVIASIHGQFKMSREAMTERLCRAIQNPYTTWVGHISGRLLLGRPAYDFDWEKVIECAKKSGVGIELNANPYRLDIDWRILPQLREAKIPVGIFPDAHSAHGLQDVEYGVYAARKGGLEKSDISNARTCKEIEAWLAARK